MIGKIKKLITKDGYGFIVADGKDYFFHRSALKDLVFEHLVAGHKVSFEPVKKNGKDRAMNIVGV